MTERSSLAHGTWEDAEALVGQEIMRLHGPDEVSAADFRRKLEVIGFDCPLHYDAQVARAHGYETVVGPVSMTRVFAIPAYWSPGQPRIATQEQIPSIAAAKVPGVGDKMIATRARMEYEAPVYPGDRISGVAVLESIERKTTRVGVGAFLKVVTTYAKQTGEVVAKETVSLFRYQEAT